MRREWLGFLLAGLLVLPASAQAQEEEAQCRKRILVYLDVSLSMKAHYADALSGLDALFREPGFIGPSDSVTFVQFGRDRGITVSGEGPGAASELIARLKSDVKWTYETDFRAAFTHLAEELPKGVFNRQVALFASDFAHEPVNGMKSDPAIADWREALSEARADLGNRFASSKKVKMLLYKRDASGIHPQQTAKQVIADLESNFGAVEYVGNPSELAIELRRSLLDPPVLQVSRDPEDSTQLRFTLTNPNCYPVHLTYLSAEPLAGGEAESFKIDDEDEGTLAQRGVPKQIRRKVPPGEEWNAAEVKAIAETRETEPASSTGTTGNWLKFAAKSAVFERRLWPLRNILRLDLEMTGYTDQATTKPYALTFGEDTVPAAQAKFEAPAFSNSGDRDYRIVLALKRQQEAGDVQVAIGGAEVLTAGGDRIALVEDARSSHTNRLLAAAGGFTVAAWLIGFIWVQAIFNAYPVFKPGRRDYAIWVVLLILVLALLLGSFLRVWLLRSQTPEDLDQWLGVTVPIVVFFLSALLILRIVQAIFARSLVSERPVPLRVYLKRSLLGNGTAWIVGAVLAGLLALSWWQASPPETQESRRSLETSPLHVTSD